MNAKELMRGGWRWVMSHKILVFVVIPSCVAAAFAIYISVIFFQWRQDRDAALKKLIRYKQLIDRTEELRKGYLYNYSDVDLTAKVVDIPTRIYERNNEIIGEFFEQKREIVPYDYMPQWLIKAVIASEDRAFYQHRGISCRGILRAFLVNVVHFRVVQGGSTITQQLAKVLFTDMDRNLKRKIYESFCAREIEKRYDKQDILSMYLNLIYFGNGAYGVESASKMFFGTSVRDLSIVESAMIVATISNPKIYSPLSDLDASLRKTRRILDSLVDAGYLKRNMAEKLYRQFLRKWEVVFDEKGAAKSSLVGNFVFSSYRINRAPHYNEFIRRMLVDRFGEDVVKRGGLSVYTTIDAVKQDAAAKALRAGIARQREHHLRLAEKFGNTTRAQQEREKAENIEGALVSIDPVTGEILAYVGGYDFNAKSQVDHVAQIRRQPGSAFKPIVYAAAVEEKVINPSTVIVDEKTRFKGGYVPRNYDGTYVGPVIAREALKRSINTVAVKVLDMAGYDKVFHILQKGLSLSDGELRDRFGRTLSLALGSYEMSPLELAQVNALLLNGGEYIYPYGIRFVKDYNDNVVWNAEEEARKLVEERRKDSGTIIDPRAGAITISMLKGVFEEGGTARSAFVNSGITFPVAGKTGTTSNYSDAWFVGFTSNSVTTVWIGNREGAISLGHGHAGGAIAAPVWVRYAAESFRGDPPADFKMPDGLAYETICLDSGEVAGRNGECPRVARDVPYYSGTEPGSYCHLHAGKKEEHQTEEKDKEK